MTVIEIQHGTADFRVADSVVRPSACELVRGDTVIKLEPKVMELLQILASEPGRVFTRQELEARVWPDMVVGYEALTKSVSKLREALGDTGKPSTFIQTIPKKGYRLIAPVAAADRPGHDSVAPRLPQRSGKRLPGAGLIMLAVLLGGVLLTLSLQNGNDTAPLRAPPGAARPSLLVLPFNNLNADPLQDYFSQGITDDLITELSGFSGIDVISSRVAFQYHGAQMDIKTLVKELGVRYVVEGSIRRNDEQIRINVNMYDTRRGINLWAEQYNRPLTSLFDIQDEVRARIVSALSVKLSETEHKMVRKRYTNNYYAYDHFLRGQSSLIQRASATDNQQARIEFEKAIAIDPDFSRAYAALAMVNADAYRHDWPENSDVLGRMALQQADHAGKLDPDSSHASLAMGYVFFFVAADHQKAAEMAERTLQLDSRNADANMLLGTIHVHAGEYKKAEAYVETSMRLNPDQPSIYFAIGALNSLLQEDYATAYRLYEQSLLINPERLLGKIYMTITLVRMNRLNEARWFAEEIRASTPGFDSERWASKQPFKNRLLNQRLREDLRLAGLN